MIIILCSGVEDAYENKNVVFSAGDGNDPGIVRYVGVNRVS